MQKEQKVRLTKKFSFEMAHALLEYPGACRNIHGHSYKLEVTVIGTPKKQRQDPEDGLVIDFSTLKELVNDAVIRPFDHALVLNEDTPGPVIESLNSAFEKIILFPFQPSCENLLIEVKKRLQGKFQEGVELFSLKLHETESSGAEWCISDNL